MKSRLFPAVAAAVMLAACNSDTKNGDSGSETDMQYIKTSVLYDTIMQIYSQPDDYLGKNYHMVGELYPSTKGDEKFYSIYAKGTGGHEGIGLELDWNDFSGFQDHETVTVEGKLEKQPRMYDGKEQEFVVLHVTKLEKRETN